MTRGAFKWRGETLWQFALSFFFQSNSVCFICSLLCMFMGQTNINDLLSAKRSHQRYCYGPHLFAPQLYYLWNGHWFFDKGLAVNYKQLYCILKWDRQTKWNKRFFNGEGHSMTNVWNNFIFIWLSYLACMLYNSNIQSYVELFI